MSKLVAFLDRSHIEKMFTVRREDGALTGT